MRRFVLAGIAVAVAVGMVGCGSGKKAAVASSPVAKATLVTASPTAPAPTVRQYASALNGPIESVQSAWKDYENGCEITQAKLACELGPQTVGLSAQTLGMTIDAMEAKVSDQDTLFLGSPPAEIAKLVEATRVAANTLADHFGTPYKPTQGWAFDALTLIDTLDGWGPYLS